MGFKTVSTGLKHRFTTELDGPLHGPQSIDLATQKNNPQLVIRPSSSEDNLRSDLETHQLKRPRAVEKRSISSAFHALTVQQSCQGTFRLAEIVRKPVARRRSNGDDTAVLPFSQGNERHP